MPVGAAAGAVAAPPVLSAVVRDHLGHQLKTVYASLADSVQPQRFLDLIVKLDAALTPQDSATGDQFRNDLLAALPDLRGFAMSLVVNPTRADDLVQETLLKAWANRHRFEPNSNLKAWLCTILRNQFYTECRKRKREVEDFDGDAAAQMIAPAAQEHGAELRKVCAVLGKLPPQQREGPLASGPKVHRMRCLAPTFRRPA